MPIVVNDFTWRETENTVTIRVPLHGVPKSKVDLFIADEYVKASFEHFFFECFPCSSIAVQESQCIIQDCCLLFELQKCTPGLWNSLEPDALSKSEKREIRQRALEKTQRQLTELAEKRRNAEAQLKREAVSLSIALSSREREKITRIKDEEKCNALGDVREWTLEATKKKKKTKKPIKTKNVFKSELIDIKVEEPDIPLPRSKAVIEVDFTPRVFPTPSRESQEAEENEWLAKQAEARRSAGFVSEDLRPEEKNPQYLLAKGTDFLKKQNYLGAISAFSFGIEISPKLTDFYILRSEAQFALGNYHKTVRDCSTALEMMKPEVTANLEHRVSCIARRGLALSKLGMKRQAVDELRAAIKLKPSDDHLERILQEIVNSAELDDSDCKGLELFENGKIVK